METALFPPELLELEPCLMVRMPCMPVGIGLSEKACLEDNHHGNIYCFLSVHGVPREGCILQISVDLVDEGFDAAVKIPVCCYCDRIG